MNSNVFNTALNGHGEHITPNPIVKRGELGGHDEFSRQPRGWHLNEEGGITSGGDTDKLTRSHARTLACGGDAGKRVTTRQNGDE